MNNDLISRSELKKAINDFYDEFFDGCFSTALITYAKGVDEIIENAPTVPLPDFKEGYKQAIIDGKTNFSRPQGEWEIVDAEGGKIWNCVCTECGHDPQEYIGGTEDWWIRKHHLPNFCPNCGVRMINVKGGKENDSL